MFGRRVISLGSCAFGIVLLILGIMEGVPLLIVAGLIGIVPSLFFYFQLFYIHVDEYEALVLHNQLTGEFSRCLGVGLHLYEIYEVPEFRFRTHPIPLAKDIEGLRSADGIPHKVSYDVSVQPCLQNLSSLSSKEMAAQVHLLAFNFREEAQSLIDQSLRNAMGKIEAKELSHGYALGMLERHFAAEIEKRFRKTGFKALRVSIGYVAPPKEFKDSLVEAKTRLIEAEYISQAIVRLQLALAQMPEGDKRLMTDWEIMRLLGGSNSSVFYSAGDRSSLSTKEAENLLINSQLVTGPRQSIRSSQRRAH